MNKKLNDRVGIKFNLLYKKLIPDQEDNIKRNKNFYF